MAWRVRIIGCLGAIACALPAHAAPPAAYPLSALSVGLDEPTSCLAAAIYYEAGYEPVEGREAVAEVVLNRLADPHYPKTVCGVVYQGSGRRTGCQFTFTCDGSARHAPQPEVWGEAVAIARRALSADPAAQPRSAGADHYHADYVRPAWSARMQQVARIGRHIFYRAHGGAPAPAPVPGPAASPQTFAPWGLSLGALSGAGGS